MGYRDAGCLLLADEVSKSSSQKTILSAAARAILGEMTRPRPSGEWAEEYLAPMFATRALAADDDHGRTSGLVVQADGLRWDELDALAR